jgi:hypothetical protein
LLLNRRKRGGGEQLVLGYSFFMLAITTTWYISGSRSNAYGFVDSVFDPAAGAKMACSPAALIEEVMATLQVLCSDLLLVRS